MKTSPTRTDQVDLTALRPHLTVRIQEDRAMLLDPVRKKYVRNTPEELVRQLVILWLFDHYSIGRGALAIEKKFTTGQREKRFDLVLLDKSGGAWMLVECKSPDVPLSAGVWDQASLYNRDIRAPFIWITNGHSHRLGQWDTTQTLYQELEFFPERS